MVSWRRDRGGEPPAQEPQRGPAAGEDDRTRAMPVVRDEQGHDPGYQAGYRDGHDPAYDRYGGVNVGAAFFGWIVAIGLTVLLTGVLGLAYTVLGLSTRVSSTFSRTDLRLVETLALVSAGVLFLVLLLSYFCGGYVAGRMSRFDGARQGVAVWGFALMFGLLAAVAGFVLGERYDLTVGSELPTLGLSLTDLSLAGLGALAVLLLTTLGAAAAGGRLGTRYHAKVDRER